MQPDDRVVPAGAIAASLEIVEALHGRDGGASQSQVMDRIMQGLKIWGPSGVTEAFGTIIFVAAQQLRPAPDEPDAIGLRMQIVSTVLSRLRRDVHEVPAERLPIVAGILTAAFLELDPYGWRTSFGSIEPDEPLAWCYTAWLLVDLVDSTTERPGGFAETLRTVLTSDS